MTSEFYIETNPIDNGPGFWQYLAVSIYQRSSKGTTQIGSYIRNYSAMYNTFYPFQKEGRWYALYSMDYTATRVMELPSCRDVAGEVENKMGFCPVDFYVPYEHEKVISAGQSGHFAFVSGCVWGDDSSWKIQFIDLSRLESGVIHRHELFGYLSTAASKSRLKDCVSLSAYDPPDYPFVSLTAEIAFNISTGARCELGDI